VFRNTRLHDRLPNGMIKGASAAGSTVQPKEDRMLNWASAALAVCTALMGIACSAAPDEVGVQGTYDGTWKQGDATGEAQAEVIALGGNAYKVYLTRKIDAKRTSKAELEGKAEGEKLALAGKVGDTEWAASWTNGEIRGQAGKDLAFELKRTVRKPPTLGKAPPEGAVVILDGKSFDRAVKRDGADWKLVGDGGVQVPTGGIRTKEAFEGNLDIHLEFRCNFRPTSRGQGRGNSGFYLPNGSELQILDSFGFKPSPGSCGAFYAEKPPLANASLPPMQWQTYDIEYRTRSRKGKKTGKPWVTVLHNGVKIHDGVELRRSLRKAQMYLQDHHNPVCFRNFWLVPVEGK